MVAPLRNETGEIEYFFGAQVDVSSLFHKHNDLSAILSKDFALSEPPASESRKSFFRRLSEKTRIHTTKPLMPLTPGLEEEVVRENITIGEQMDVFRSAYARVPRPQRSPLFPPSRNMSLDNSLSPLHFLYYWKVVNIST